MYFTLAVSAATPEACAALAGAAGRTDPRVMPIPGPARVAWHAPGGRAAVLHWGDAPSPGTSHGATSHAGTIWAEGATVRARTGLARIDPVYLAEVAGAVVVSDRACWAGTSWTTPGRVRCSASSAAVPPNACSARRKPTGRGPGR